MTRAPTQGLAAIVLAAGKGTRMKSALPKVLHPVLGRPLGHWSVAAAFEAGASPVVVVVGHGAEAVERSLAAEFGDRVRCAVQEEQLGTGHAARVGLDALGEHDGPVLLLYGDTPLLTAPNLEELARRARTEPLAMWTCELDDPTGYGRIVRDPEGRVQRIVEHKDAGEHERAITEVNPGMYCAQGPFLAQCLKQLRNDNAQGEYYLTDIVEMAVAEVGDVSTLKVPFEETLGVNDRSQLAEADGILRARALLAHMKNGVTVLDPTSTRVEAHVILEPDVVLEPGVVLRGRTKIASGVTVGTGCVLTDTTIEQDATLHPYCVCEEAHVGRGCSVGPFARLRPEAVLEEDARVGNFVEVKKATLGRGAKANHLAYLGDATIGAGTNIGAGTITCNYDGIGKHRTTLGEGVFIGSNSTLVAPLTVGDGAYVGAGSTVGKDVPAGALAIGRVRQENKEGYAARIRARNEARKKNAAKG